MQERNADPRDPDEWLHFAPSAERNWQVIAEAGANWFSRGQRLLEVGSGTGQHAATIGAAYPGLHWQPSEMPAAVPMLRANCERFNLTPPMVLDADDWPRDLEGFDLVYTANTLHIAAESSALNLIRGAGLALVAGGHLLVYGPFRYGGKFTTQSNADFDEWLRARDPRSGIRDFEHLDDVARASGMLLVTDIPMPANNQLLVWRKLI